MFIFMHLPLQSSICVRSTKINFSDFCYIQFENKVGIVFFLLDFLYSLIVG